MFKQLTVLAVILLMAAPLNTIGKSAANNENGDDSPIMTKASNPKLKAPITLWARDANLSEVLKVLSEKSGMNFVAGEGVHREKITIILEKTPLDEAINLLVRAAGLAYEIIGNSVLIAEAGKLKDEVGQAGYVVELKYAKAKEVAKMLEDLTENVKVDEGGNMLICYTSPRVINEIEKIVKSIDHPHILVVLETRLIEVSMDRLDDIGIDWGEVSPLEFPIEKERTSFKDLFSTNNWYQLPLNINVALDLLLSDGDARLLMNSKLTTTNNREATMHIGEIIPYVIQSYNSDVSGGASQEIQKEEVGVKVSMTPHINDENQITLSLAPEVSNIIGFKGPNSDLPLVKVRKTNTTIRVEDGQTVFLAGLLSEASSEEIKKFPVLGHIPLLGRLFWHSKKESKKSNLIIEVTPKIIRNADELASAYEGMTSNDVKIIKNYKREERKEKRKSDDNATEEKK